MATAHMMLATSPEDENVGIARRALGRALELNPQNAQARAQLDHINSVTRPESGKRPKKKKRSKP